MARVEKSVLVAHTPDCMFELVDRVEDYPDFLHWCGGTELKLRDEHRTVATIHIAYMGIRQGLTTENIKTHPREMRITLQDGPFAELEGGWSFFPLGDDACKIKSSSCSTYFRAGCWKRFWRLSSATSPILLSTLSCVVPTRWLPE